MRSSESGLKGSFDEPERPTSIASDEALGENVPRSRSHKEKIVAKFRFISVGLVE